MPYVERDGSNAIISIRSRDASGLLEYLDDNNSDVLSFQGVTLAKKLYAKKGELVEITNKFIELKPDGSTRYDTNLKLNLLIYGITNSPASSAFAWIQSVQAAYFERKGQLAAASTLSELNAVDISYQWFEDRYGVSGSVLADPDISTEDLQP